MFLYKDYSRLIFTNIKDLAYNPSIILFMYGLPVLYLLICGHIDFNLLINRMCHYGKAILILYGICFFYFRIGTASLSIEYMTFSYYALPSICVCLLYTNLEKKSQYMSRFLAMMGLIITLIAGARGALVCNLTFILLILLFSNRIHSNKKLIIYILLTLVILVLACYFNEIVNYLISLLNSKGIYSRTLEKMTQASFANSDDRNVLWNVAMIATKKSPLIGYGMWGDRPIVDGYVHNFIVEILCSYGFLFGGILIFCFFGLIFTILFKYKWINQILLNLFLISIPMGIVQLMFSGSYLTNIWFFFVLGIIYNIKKVGKIRKVNKYNESYFDIQ